MEDEGSGFKLDLRQSHYWDPPNFLGTRTPIRERVTDPGLYHSPATMEEQVQMEGEEVGGKKRKDVPPL
jgi:hypothetical protein